MRNCQAPRPQPGQSGPKAYRSLTHSLAAKPGVRSPDTTLGDWKCPSCGNTNFFDREVCNMRSCRTPRPEPGLDVPQVEAPGSQARGDASEMWQCLACGNMNFADRSVCNMRKCGTPRGELAAPEDLRPAAEGLSAHDAGIGAVHKVAQPALQRKGKGKQAKSGPSSSRGTEWQCPACDNVNFADRPFCNMRKCGAPRPLEPWTCEKCGNNNFANRETCNMRKCQAARPDVPPEVLRFLTSKGKGKGSAGK